MSRATERRRGAAARSGAASPRPVTRGESGQAAKVDWLHATFPAPSLSVEGFIAFLGRLFGRPISATPAPGLFGFAEGVRLVAHYGSRRAAMGSLSWGGEQQAGRWFLQLTGAGCSMLSDWEGLGEFLQGLDAKLTRVDLAVDFLHGEHCVEEAWTLYEMGGFTLNGRAPSSSLAGDWVNGVEGRTFYVGKAANGKSLRVYEKGKQLGDLSSEWVRFEVQLGNRDRVIPFEALTDRDAFFAGCYPALAGMVDDAADYIETQRTESAIAISHLMRHAVRSYGKLFGVVAELPGATHTDLVEEVRVIGLPRRVHPSSLVAGLTWEQLLSQMKGMK